MNHSAFHWYRNFSDFISNANAFKPAPSAVAQCKVDGLACRDSVLTQVKALFINRNFISSFRKINGKQRTHQPGTYDCNFRAHFKICKTISPNLKTSSNEL